MASPAKVYNLNDCIPDGTLCHSEHEYCSPNPCQNNGICEVGSNGFRCRCPQLFSGKVCQRSMLRGAKPLARSQYQSPSKDRHLAIDIQQGFRFTKS